MALDCGDRPRRIPFEIVNHIRSLKMFYDKRILVKDSNDNRYEIPNIYDLDKRSQKLILPNM